MDNREFSAILSVAVKSNSSDIILIPGQKPTLRAFGNFIELATENLTAEDTNWIAEHVMQGRGTDWAKFTQAEVSYEEKGLGRFRVSICQSRYQKLIAIRVIPTQTRTFNELNLPQQVVHLANLERGLVLVTGATGQGKSTTVSAMLEEINQNRKAFVLTIEDPIEFIYEPNQALIGQREIGEDATSYKDAIRHALRQRPNAIFVGEIRDAETFEAVLTAAETGHLVFSTMHTTDVATTINRILSFYPEAERESVRLRLSNSLGAILTLRLLKRRVPTIDGKIPQLCLIPACELMVSSPTIKESIKSSSLDKTNDRTNTEKLGSPSNVDVELEQASLGRATTLPTIETIIEREGRALLTGGNPTMFNFDQYICYLLQKGEIDLATAKAAATRPDEVERYDILQGNQVVKSDPSKRKLKY
ncbi:MAG: Flp pilus assembly complex ATPase component TadA [Blastocatellia bacterium]|nr:Flp pilus assembly complex ATPase component TadA [Blastocatellia bacterium]